MRAAMHVTTSLLGCRAARTIWQSLGGTRWNSLRMRIGLRDAVTGTRPSKLSTLNTI
jgi:hypothetical protein